MDETEKSSAFYVFIPKLEPSLCVGKYCSPTISGHSSLCAGEQVSEEPLGVLRLSHGLTQTVDKDRSTAVGLQHRADEPLQEDEELLVLCGKAHLKTGG